MKTTLILHLWWSLFKASLIQLNAKAYCMMFDQVVLFCSECCFICWFMYHNKSNWQEKRLRASRGAKDCCNEKQNSERHFSCNQHHRQKANWFYWIVFWHRCICNWHWHSSAILWIYIVNSCLFGKRVKKNVPLACAISKVTTKWYAKHQSVYFAV